MPKKIVIEFKQDRVRVLAENVTLEEIEEAADVLLQAIIDQRTIKNKRNEKSKELVKLSAN